MDGESNLEHARAAVQAVVSQALEKGLRVCATVVDSAGHVVIKERMDGVSPVSSMFADDKAYTAATLNMPSADLQPLVQPGGQLFGLTTAAGGRLIAFGGGIPLRVDGTAIGGLGVSGCKSAAEDVALADTGVRAWLASRESAGGSA
jgi:uncharacterized protein GlcG (DUF336 family)